MLRALLRFTLVFVLAYCLLLAPWPGLREGYGNFFQAMGNLCLGTLGEDSRFVWRAEGDFEGLEHNTEIHMYRHETVPGKYRVFVANHYRKGYLPTAMLVAMVLATPMRLSRRLRCLALGVVLLHVFIGFRLLVKLTLLFSLRNGWALFEIDSGSRAALRFVVEALYTRLLGTFIAPIFVWLAVCFRSSQLLRFLSQESER